MLENLDLKNVLVIDIETVSQFPGYGHLDDSWKDLWSRKMKYLIKDNVTAEETYDRAAIYAEFGKIVCISAGVYRQENGDFKFHIKSFYGHDEKALLQEFSEMVNKNFFKEEHMVIGHNAKEFDFPFIARRCLINGIPIPFIFDNSGKKPWEVRLMDTMELWKFGDHKNYTSLDLLAAVFGISSPKGDMDGSMVGEVYWKFNDIERISKYCQMDVITVARLLMKFKGLEPLKDENIIYTN